MLGTLRPTGIMVLLVGSLLAFPTLAHAASVQADFDGDGLDDLAVGVPLEDQGGAKDVGVVHVIYGDGAGLTATDSQRWRQDSPSIAGEGERGDRFGASLAAGDFDDDTFDDLAIGASGEGVSQKGAGAVNVLYGSGDGLTAVGDQLWHQNKSGIAGGAETEDHFGDALTAGDFDDDGADDLTIGVPNEDLAGKSNVGGLHAMYGSGNGLTATDAQAISGSTPGIGGSANEGDRFGEVLAAGDFDGDDAEDLAVGTPHRSPGGVVRMIYGSVTGLAPGGDESFTQKMDSILGEAESGDLFGDSLAAGDLDGDGTDDLAVGVPGEGLSGKADAGAVHAIYGSGDGLTAVGDQLWHQGRPGIEGVVQKDDAFGGALTAGNFNGGDSDDLAIGAPGEDLSVHEQAGAVHAIYGSGDGLTATDSQLWHEDSSGILDFSNEDDMFGASLTAGDFNRGADDLAIGIPGEDLSGSSKAGAVHAIYSTGEGLTATDNQRWHQNTAGIVDEAGAGDAFGLALPG